jgi:hypothetical protein
LVEKSIICAVICGAQGWLDVETFGNSKLPWLKTFPRTALGHPQPWHFRPPVCPSFARRL